MLLVEYLPTFCPLGFWEVSCKAVAWPVCWLIDLVYVCLQTGSEHPTLHSHTHRWWARNTKPFFFLHYLMALCTEKENTWELFTFSRMYVWHWQTYSVVFESLTLCEKLKLLWIWVAPHCHFFLWRFLLKRACHSQGGLFSFILAWAYMIHEMVKTNTVYVVLISTDNFAVRNGLLNLSFHSQN